MAGVTLPVLEGSLREGSGTALVRPESVRLEPHPAGGATVVTSSFLGAISRLGVEAADGSIVITQVPRSEAAGISVGDRVHVRIDPSPILVVSD